MRNHAANPGECLGHVHDVGDFFEILLGDRVEADDEAVEGVELGSTPGRSRRGEA